MNESQVIPVAASNAAFLVFASRYADSDLVYSEDFARAVDEALKAAAGHMLAEVERELSDAKRMIALLVLEAGGKVALSRRAITEMSDATVIETTQDVINGGWVIRARDPRG